jgi:hypothetical protein
VWVIEGGEDFGFAQKPRQSLASLATSGGSTFRATSRLSFGSFAR